MIFRREKKVYVRDFWWQGKPITQLLHLHSYSVSGTSLFHLVQTFGGLLVFFTNYEIELQVWLTNVPRTSLFEAKGSQKWISIKNNMYVFPGGGRAISHLDRISKVSLFCNSHYILVCMCMTLIAVSLIECTDDSRHWFWPKDPSSIGHW